MHTLIAVLMTITSVAPITANAPPPFQASGAFFALSVADLDASRAWYRDTLGLTVVSEPPAYQGIRVVILEGGGLTVELIHNPKSRAHGSTDATLVRGFSKVGFVVDDFDRTLAGIRARGIQLAFGPFPSRPGQRANFAIKDNDGNLIQLFGR